MGGPVGAMSPKLVLKAGMLLFAARLDGHSATATIDPTAAETVISSALAAHLNLPVSGDGDQEVRRFHVIGMDHAELRLHRVLVRSVPGPAMIVIGQDLLTQMRIQLDFRRGRLRVFDRTDRFRIGNGESVIPLKPKANGCLALGAPDAPVPAAFATPADLAADTAPAPLDVGGVQLPVSDAASSDSCGSGTKVVTWTSFHAMRVTIDLPHEQLIVEKDHGTE